MAYSKPLVLSAPEIRHCLRSTAVDGRYLEAPEAVVYSDPGTGYMVVRLPEAAHAEFFRQVYKDFGEEIATSLTYRKRRAPRTGALYFPDVTLDEADLPITVQTGGS